MILVHREPASHWYLKDGTPFHEVERADGNGTRAVTLRDARKVGAFPSVTNFLSVLHKPGLVAWQQEQAILAALTLPRQTDEPLDAFARRVVQDMGEQVQTAASLGSALHAAAEIYANSKLLPEDADVARLFDPVREWFDADVERVACVEAVVKHTEFGYAGRVDMVARLKSTDGWALVDFKSQKFKKDAKGRPKAAFYEVWPLQLEAYRQAILHEGALRPPQDIVSVAINSIEPVPVEVRAWPRDQHGSYFRAFLNARDLWVFMRGYCPIAASSTDY